MPRSFISPTVQDEMVFVQCYFCPSLLLLYKNVVALFPLSRTIYAKVTLLPLSPLNVVCLSFLFLCCVPWHECQDILILRNSRLKGEDKTLAYIAF